MQAVPALDVPRYLGRWYEVAKLPNWFQRQCARDTSAEYRAQATGELQVINRCRKASGEMIEAQGLARQLGGAQSATLQVRFAPAWLSWLPLVWGDYWVVDLDPAYDLVAVSEPRREYLWILSRQPKVDPQRYRALLDRLAGMGLPVEQLELTEHSAP
jgi:apolipoprotein D and lipocalin family protein